MPVSKKRKKDGKPVHRSEQPVVVGAESAHGPESKASALQTQMGKPSNPFVARQQAKHAALRGR